MPIASKRPCGGGPNERFRMPAVDRHFARLFFSAALITASAAGSGYAVETTLIAAPMQRDAWEVNGEAEFTASPDAAGGVMNLTRGSALLKGAVFKDGTIDFDIKPAGHGVLGLRFRQQDKRDAEAFFVRPQKGCATSEDCVQYMPFAHGAYEWDLYPEGQAAAPLSADGWNHVKLVVSGRRLNVFINGGAKPVLAVPRLAGDDKAGGLSVTAPASYANLVIRPGFVGELPPEPLAEPGDTDPRVLRRWKLSPAFPLPSRIDPALQQPVGVAPSFSALPVAAAHWRTIRAEPKGLVNLSRELGSSAVPTTISAAWAKTTIVSSRRQTKTVEFGWAREAWVYVNGKLIYADRNLYGVPGSSKAPDGRLGYTNGSFELPLQKGRNDLAVLVDDNFPSGSLHFGWGFEMRLKDMAGVSTGPTL